MEGRREIARPGDDLGQLWSLVQELAGEFMIMKR